ncbi:MAG: TetR/AcrR family transcriptional regulator [Planctomycetales bacterium]|nr:TetR/AcrR family transcriptional regulator [Planctomycetales bacterium]
MTGAPTRLPPDDRRDQLRRCARRIFSTKGYHATGVADIIEAAGVARGTFYLYFAGKRALFDDLLDGLFEAIRGAVRRVTLDDPARPPLAQVRENAERVLAILIENEDLAKILLSEAVGLDPDGEGKLLRFYDLILGVLERTVRLGQGAGLVRAGDPPLLARMLLGCVKEVMYRYVVAGERRPLRELADALLDFAGRGILARSP